jgi:dTDP-4-dehydrorhamnose 3,5-epimerase
METEKYLTELPGVFLLGAHEVFEDHRGSYEQLYHRKNYGKLIMDLTGEDILFEEDDIAISRKHVLRGLHGDNRTWKLVTCLKGAYYIIVACNDPNSPYYLDWQHFVLSDRNKLQLLIPPMHGHGYVVMTDEAIFHYKQSCAYQGMSRQFTINWKDPRFNFWWPVQDPILSVRDSGNSVEMKQ